jgi:3-oxoacyl-[acyl-carrier-protein] synthase II
MRARPTRFHECSAPVDLVAEGFGLYGPSFAISTACSSGALAIATAAELIQSGQADVMLAGGTDSLSHTTWAGFHSLLLVDAQGCRPFDATRGGMSFGEGAAILILEAEEHARKRGAKILARLTGWGASCDAHHVTAPHPDGAGALAAMQSALHRAQLTPADIGYVNAHGTGTRDNDLAESKALRSLFGANVPPFSSTKRFFGHALAASGAIEAVVCIEALRRQQLPANPGFRQIDPGHWSCARHGNPRCKADPRDEQLVRVRWQQRRADFFDARNRTTHAPDPGGHRPHHWVGGHRSGVWRHLRTPDSTAVAAGLRNRS